MMEMVREEKEGRLHGRLQSGTRPEREGSGQAGRVAAPEDAEPSAGVMEYRTGNVGAKTSEQTRVSSFRQLLLAHRNADGGWGFQAGGPSAVEATAWALLALRSARAVPEEANTMACQWLMETQLADGSWPAFAGQPEGCWVTSLACQALHLEDGAQEALARGLAWLLDSWPAEGTWWWRVRQSVFPAGVSGQDPSQRGWGWTARTANWVEPTAYALLLLKALPPEMLSARAGKRRVMAEGMLLGRMCPGGGWNSGNPRIYGVAGVPRVGPTAWALLALQDHPERAEIQMSCAWLERAYGTIRGAASLALAHRCLAVYGRRLPPLAPVLRHLYQRNRFLENVLTTAWAVLALSGEDAAPGAGEAATR